MRSVEKLISPESDYYTYHPSAIASRVYLYPISVGDFFYEPGYSLNRSRFDSYLLMYIAQGSCRFTVSGEEPRTVPAGKYILMDCYRPQSYSFDVPTEALWLHFDGCNARNYFEQITELHGQVLTAGDRFSPAAGIRSILQTFRDSHTLHEAPVSNTITEMLQSLLETDSGEGNGANRTYAIERARSYISRHYADPVTLEELAERANLSPYHFTRVFAAETGFTPHQYLLAARLSAAKYFLCSQELPSIKEIALRCGFHSESSFCTTFRKWENMTPSQYRAMAFHTDAL
ncbi:MAG: AraC family transcriptional regulator [Lachnospiraceae bacterium]|nr:AraC family transcriptional regulator [Lachnospiraceae bacterium]